jgi:V/A-type H+-transporting ATPase subunit I
MGADLAAMEELKLVHVAITSVPHRNFSALQIALSGFPIILNRCYLTRATDFVCLAMPSKLREEVERILKTHHSEIFQIPDDLSHDVAAALGEVENRLVENRGKEEAAQASLRSLGEENRTNLASWKETTENVLELLRAEGRILQSGRLATVKGFAPSKKLHALAQKVTSALNGRAIVLENSVIPDDPPTNIRHNRFVKPFEEITRLYGLPHYDELNPTPVIAVTFPLLFGLMFGDVGHGLVLLLGGLTLGKLIKNNQSMKNLCNILAACGVGAIFAGALFGEFFGIELFPPLWFNPFNNVLSFLIFSLIVGIAQITSGIVLEMVNFALKRSISDIVFTSIPKAAFYLGSTLLIAVYQLDFGVWLSGPILLAIVPFSFLVLGEPVFYAAKRLSWYSVEIPRERKSLGERLFESGDLVTRLLSNTFSYTRILALLMAHWALILVTYEVAGLVGSSSLVGVILSGIVVVGGNLFVIALEGLIVFIHALRLHFYEWFSKFYQGTGTEFAPFKQKFIYTEIVLNKSQ